MSPSIVRIFTRVVRVPLNRGVFQYNNTTMRMSSVRPLALSSHLEAKSENPSDKQMNEPIKFSTSKASPRTWKVDRSMGSQYERPWTKVLPITLICTAFMLWCALRKRTDLDDHLDKPLHETIPSLRPDEEKPS